MTFGAKVKGRSALSLRVSSYVALVRLLVLCLMGALTGAAENYPLGE